MPAFLIQYHRPSGKVSVEQYESLQEATEVCFTKERKNTDDDLEIVVIQSPNEESLRKSHSRYFDFV